MNVYRLFIEAPASNGSVNETMLASFYAENDTSAIALVNNRNNTDLFHSGLVNWRYLCVLRRAGEWSGSKNINFKKAIDKQLNHT